MKNRKKWKDEDFQAKFVEVTSEQCRGNFEKMIRRFSKKVKKEDILSVYYDRLSHYKTRGQKKREKKLKGIWNQKKKQKKDIEIDKSVF